jgi:hypothetical protein
MPKPRTKVVLNVIGVVSAATVVGAIVFAPGLDSDWRGIHAVRAVSSLRRLTPLEQQFAAENPEAGFACHLWQLPSKVTADGRLFRFGALATGSSDGYEFQIRNCVPDIDGVVRRYHIVATPSRPGVSGTFAFYADESGAVFVATVESPPLRVH